MDQKEINKQIFKRLEKLEYIVLKTKGKNKGRNKTRTSFPKLDFNISQRAFIKKYGKGLSGPKKFALIVAYLANGKEGKEVSIGEIKKNWDKMTSLLGGKFNTYYSTTAKDNNWADSKKYGIWFLTKDWQKIFL